MGALQLVVALRPVLEVIVTSSLSIRSRNSHPFLEHGALSRSQWMSQAKKGILFIERRLCKTYRVGKDLTTGTTEGKGSWLNKDKMIGNSISLGTCLVIVSPIPPIRFMLEVSKSLFSITWQPRRYRKKVLLVVLFIFGSLTWLVTRKNHSMPRKKIEKKTLCTLTIAWLLLLHSYSLIEIK